MIHISDKFAVAFIHKYGMVSTQLILSMVVIVCGAGTFRQNHSGLQPLILKRSSIFNARPFPQYFRVLYVSFPIL